MLAHPVLLALGGRGCGTKERNPDIEEGPWNLYEEHEVPRAVKRLIIQKMWSLNINCKEAAVRLPSTRRFDCRHELGANSYITSNSCH